MPLQHALNAFSMLSPLLGNEVVRIQKCWELPRDNRLGYFRTANNYVICSWQHAGERKHVPSNDWDPTQSFAENNSRVYRSCKPEKKNINTSHLKVILVLRNVKSLAWIAGDKDTPHAWMSTSINIASWNHGWLLVWICQTEIWSKWCNRSYLLGLWSVFQWMEDDLDHAPQPETSIQKQMMLC